MDRLSAFICGFTSAPEWGFHRYERHRLQAVVTPLEPQRSAKRRQKGVLAADVISILREGYRSICRVVNLQHDVDQPPRHIDLLTGRLATYMSLNVFVGQRHLDGFGLSDVSRRFQPRP